jgi:hypothetical protein
MTVEETIQAAQAEANVGECVETIANTIAHGLNNHLLYEDIIDFMMANPHASIEQIVKYFEETSK